MFALKFTEYPKILRVSKLLESKFLSNCCICLVDWISTIKLEIKLFYNCVIKQD